MTDKIFNRFQRMCLWLGDLIVLAATRTRSYRLRVQSYKSDSEVDEQKISRYSHAITKFNEATDDDRNHFVELVAVGRGGKTRPMLRFEV